MICQFRRINTFSSCDVQENVSSQPNQGLRGPKFDSIVGRK